MQFINKDSKGLVCLKQIEINFTKISHPHCSLAGAVEGCFSFLSCDGVVRLGGC